MLDGARRAENGGRLGEHRGLRAATQEAPCGAREMSVPRPGMDGPSATTTATGSSVTVSTLAATGGGASASAAASKFRKPGKFGEFGREASENAARKAADPLSAPTSHYGRSGCYVNPSSDFVKYWDIWVVTLLVYTAFVTPYEIAFLETSINALWVFNRIVDVSFLCDMVVNFMMPYYDVDRQQWITRPSQIAKRYVLRWFTLDLLSILPIDTVVFFTADENSKEDASQLRIFRIVRLLRLMKLLRVFRASRILNRWKSVLGISNSILSLSKFGMAATFVAHWSACLWALAPSVEEGETNWMMTLDMAPDASAGEIYTACLYWSVMTLTTIGYGDIAPQTTAERLVAILCMLTGGSIYAYIIGAVCGIVSNIDKATSSYLQALDNLNRYMAEIKLPNDLRLQLREYFDHCRQLHRNKYYQGLLLQMSPSLRKAVAMHCHSVWIRAVPFFNAPDDDERSEFVASISVVLVPMAFAPLEKIVLEGEKTSKMYIIQRGLAIRRGKLLGAGDFFGEDMILTNARRAYSVRSLTFLDVYSLSKRGLRDALNAGEFAKTKKLIRRAAIKLALRREMMKAVVTAGMKRTMLDTIANAAALAGRGSGSTQGSANTLAKERVLATVRSRHSMSFSKSRGGGSLASVASRGQLLLGKRSSPANRDKEKDVKAVDSGVDELIDNYATEVHGAGTGSRRLPTHGGAMARRAVLGASRRRAAPRTKPVSQMVREAKSAAVGRESADTVESVHTIEVVGDDDGDDDHEVSDNEEIEDEALAAQGGYEMDPLDEARRAAEREEAHRASLEETMDRDEDSGDFSVLATTPKPHKPLVAPVDTKSKEPVAAAADQSKTRPRFEKRLAPLQAAADAGEAGARAAAGGSPPPGMSRGGPGRGPPATDTGRGGHPRRAPDKPRPGSRGGQPPGRGGGMAALFHGGSRGNGGSGGSGGAPEKWNVLNVDAVKLISKTLVPALRNLERSQVNLETSINNREVAAHNLETTLTQTLDNISTIVISLESKSKWLNLMLFAQSMIIIVTLVLLSSA